MSAKVNDSVVKEYVRRLNEDDLRFFYGRFTQMLCGDRAEIVERSSLNKEMDRLYSLATGPNDLFDILDVFSDFVKKEHIRRFGDRKES